MNRFLTLFYPAVILFFTATIAAQHIYHTKLKRSYQEQINIIMEGNAIQRANIEARDKIIADYKKALELYESVYTSNRQLIEANFETIQQLLTRVPPVYIISHYPFAGFPWILEVWWPEKLLWVPLVAYHHRSTAEDVKERLERGEVEERFLVR